MKKVIILLLLLTSCAGLEKPHWIQRAPVAKAISCQEGQEVSSEIVFCGMHSQLGLDSKVPEFEVTLRNCGDRKITFDFPFNWGPSVVDSIPFITLDFIDCYKKQIGYNMSVSWNMHGDGLAPYDVTVNPNETVVFKFRVIADGVLPVGDFLGNLQSEERTPSDLINWDCVFFLRYRIHQVNLYNRSKYQLKWLELKTKLVL